MVKIKGIKTLWLVTPVVLGAFVALFSVPVLHDIFPSDFKRTKFILNVLADKTEYSPDVLVFGSSVSMASINGRALSDSLNQEVFNLSSTGQSLPESMLYYSMIDSNVKTVIQCISFDELNAEPYLDLKKIRNFRLYDYFPDSETLHLLEPLKPVYLSAPKLKILIDARALVKNAIDVGVRKFLRKDLDIGKMTTELYYPTPYTTRFSPEKYKLNVAMYNPPEPITNISLNSIFGKLLKRNTKYYSDRNINYFLLINPQNPSLTNYSKTLFSQIDSLRGTGEFAGLNLLNYFDLLQDADFIDYCHPSPSGSRKVTKRLLFDIKSSEKK